MLWNLNRSRFRLRRFQPIAGRCRDQLFQSALRPAVCHCPPTPGCQDHRLTQRDWPVHTVDGQWKFACTYLPYSRLPKRVQPYRSLERTCLRVALQLQMRRKIY